MTYRASSDGLGQSATISKEREFERCLQRIRSCADFLTRGRHEMTRAPRDDRVKVDRALGADENASPLLPGARWYDHGTGRGQRFALVEG